VSNRSEKKIRNEIKSEEKFRKIKEPGSLPSTGETNQPQIILKGTALTAQLFPRTHFEK